MIELNGTRIREPYINSIILRLCEFANGSELYELDELEEVINSYVETMKYFLANHCTGPLYLTDIKDLAKVFFENNGLSPEIRTSDVVIGNNDFIPPNKTHVPYLIQEALQTYNLNSEEDVPFSFSPVVKELDIYDNEALFHINFVRIQPFEDGNKRMAHLLTALNFLKYYGRKDILPPILSVDQREEYFEALKNNDYKRLSDLYRGNCQREQEEFERLSESGELGQSHTNS